MPKVEAIKGLSFSNRLTIQCSETKYNSILGAVHHLY